MLVWYWSFFEINKGRIWSLFLGQLLQRIRYSRLGLVSSPLGYQQRMSPLKGNEVFLFNTLLKKAWKSWENAFRNGSETVFISKSFGIKILILLPSSHSLTQHIGTATKSVMVEVKLRTKVNRNDYKRLLTLYRDISFERSQLFDPLIPYLIIEFGGTCNEKLTIA